MLHSLAKVHPTRPCSMSSTTTCADEVRQLAAALAGDAVVLRQLAHADIAGELARRFRLGAALALAAGEQGIDGPALVAWQRQLHEVSALFGARRHLGGRPRQASLPHVTKFRMLFNDHGHIKKRDGCSISRQQSRMLQYACIFF
jgi:hypothetical protein